MIIELNGLPIPRDDWQVIKKPEQLVNLKRINVIAYERIRMPIDRARPHLTYGKKLRHRIGVMVRDEGDVLANPESDQSRALMVVAPKKAYTLSGTPIANYPRDILPVMALTVGDGTAAQPWGWRNGHLEPRWINSMSYAERGIDAFRGRFVVLQWSTREFDDSMQQGAKREIPRIANLKDFRAMVAPHIKRRVTGEPGVRKHVKIGTPTRETVNVPWDPGHVAYFIQIADEFATWYREHMKNMHQRNNLIALLAHIRGVSFASDYPQHPLEGFAPYLPLTSKQRWAIDELERLTNEGHKTVLYAENPGQIKLISRELEKRGVESMVFHGGITPEKRMKELNARFRFGDCPNLLGTLGVTQKGLNLWQADQVIMLSRSWSALTEEQAIRRLLRPQQVNQVRVQYVRSEGGIEDYKEQLVSMKKDAADSGLDWATPTTADVEFLHLTTIIHRFVENLAVFKGVHRGSLLAHLKQEAAYAT